MRYWDVERTYNSRIQVRCKCGARINGSITRKPDTKHMFSITGTCYCGIEFRGTFSGLLIRDGEVDTA